MSTKLIGCSLALLLSGILLTATACVTTGSRSAQVAAWRRQLERNPDARVKRDSTRRNWRKTDEQIAAEGAGRVAVGVLAAGDHIAQNWK
ncbi:MAG: hypothetical protein ACYTHK_07985 [Planctomycetota bacterium]|jgi:hypothetical protein